MEHEIDLSKFDIRCDLIKDKIDKNSIKGLNISKRKYKNIVIENVEVDNELSIALDKKKGIYSTIYFEDVTDFNNRSDVIHVLVEELNFILKKNDLLNKSCLVIGLGNSLSTADSLGPKVVDNIIVTKHLFDIDEIEVSEGYGNVAAFSPGVYATTGIESFDVISGIVSKINPSFLIVIDSLASSSLKNVNRVIQLTDSGIEPGSGVGNNRKEISFDSLNIPVISLGVPTVVDAATIVKDTFNFLIKKISYNIVNVDNEKNKLISPNNINYLNVEYTLDSLERKKFFGLIGELNEEEVCDLMKEVLSPIGYNFVVTPKEIDFLVDKLALVLSKSINMVMHKEMFKNREK